MFRQLTAQNLPSPLDFMANINNAATFQLAQTLQIHGNSLFLAVNQQTIWQPLRLALLDLEQQEMPSALVGWVLENDNGQQEGACFWVVSKEAESAVGNRRVSQISTLLNRSSLIQAIPTGEGFLEFLQRKIVDILR